MAGHSKWANTKHRKARQDQKRAKEHGKAVRKIEAAARESGTSDPEMSPSVLQAVQDAKDISVPKDNIERALKRGAGELDEGVAYDSGSYEGYAPGGVAVLVDILTDNRNRTAADVRSAFSKTGGNLAEPGAVSFMFSRRGQVVLEGTGLDEDDLMMAGLDHGLEEIDEADDVTLCWCAPNDFADLRGALKESSFTVKQAGSEMVPNVTVPIADAGDAKRILRLLDALEDNDDVQEVWHNADFADGLLDDIDLD
jgi:YebC/PmpR family DNA-binding regulatory protein